MVGTVDGTSTFQPGNRTKYLIRTEELIIEKGLLNKIAITFLMDKGTSNPESNNLDASFKIRGFIK